MAIAHESGIGSHPVAEHWQGWRRFQIWKHAPNCFCGRSVVTEKFANTRDNLHLNAPPIFKNPGRYIEDRSKFELFGDRLKFMVLHIHVRHDSFYLYNLKLILHIAQRSEARWAQDISP